jgi:hypothetical protein
LNPKHAHVLNKLQGGDLRSIGKAEEVVQEVLENPTLFTDVFEGMLSEDPVISMRSADVIEKVAKKHPEYLQPFKFKLIHEVSQIDQKEVRWHVAQMFSYLKINQSERDEIMKILLTFITTESSIIVKTFSMQTLAIFADREASIRPQIIELIEEMMKTGSPAIISRGKKLINKLKS